MIKVGYTPASSSAWLRMAATRLLWRIWWIAFVPVALIGYGLAADWRWAVVGLMLIFIVFPMVMSLAILRYATLPRIANLLQAAVAVIDDGGITLATEEKELARLNRADIKAVSIGRQYIGITFGTAIQDFTIIPTADLPQEAVTAISALAPADSWD